MSHGIIGVDLGALTVKGVILDGAGELLNSAYRFHQGNPLAALGNLLDQLTNGADLRVAITGSGAKLCPPHDDVRRVDDVQAAIAAVTRLVPEARNILDIGGGSLTLVRLDGHRRFLGFSANSQCAAGTGSFLDEQAMRLGLTYDDIAHLEGVDDPPSVATRCAVFAKSDLIHLQQAGATPQEMWSGLCRGMSQTALQTLLKGKPLEGLTALIGGVAQNREVLRWLRDLSNSPLTTNDDAHIAGALGAAWVAHADPEWTLAIDWREWLAQEDRRPLVPIERSQDCDASEKNTTVFASEHAHEPLALTRTHYPSFDVLESYTDDETNEVRISRWPAEEHVRGTLGIDVGSTSTKLCLIDDEGVLVDIYRKTAGDPIGATKKLFDSLGAVAQTRGAELEILGCGTTGSGRKLVGALVGADAVVNEITAHVAGAMHVDPELETIFEIGGQDSKYMRTRAGRIADANMNYVCAAGTGSFVEEQARKLGVPLHEVGDRVLGLVPPQSSDRCTVFMEQDVNKLLRSGHDASQALAAVMRSVVQNYLNKVVGNRHYSRTKIGFQGATARNKGLVAAFETLLGVEMVVSPYCHVMGAWGVALLTQEEMREQETATTFVGLDLSSRQITLRKDRCDMCSNDCEITHASIEGAPHEPSWGFMCGREPGADKARVNREYDLFRKRQRWLWRDGAAPEAPSHNGRRPVVGLPRALTTFSQTPMYRRLLEALGAEVVRTGESERSTRERGAALTAADFCFPIKLGHGQVAEGLENGDIDFLFVPRMVAQPPVEQQSNTFLCPYVQSFPEIVTAALEQAGIDPRRVIRPTIDRRFTMNRQVKDLHSELRKFMRVSEARVARAWQAAIASQDGFEERLERAGAKALDALAGDVALDASARPGIVFIGRPYNVADTAVNLDLPRKISEMGYRVFPIDAIPYDPGRIHSRYQNVFWSYGQRILSTLEYVRQRDDLFPIYFTNFNCGPDSFILSYAEEIMGDKPMLALELDEHGADAGYITRIEAFLDVTRSWRPSQPPARPAPTEPHEEELRDRRILVPPMHPVGSQLFAAAFRGHGYDARALPNETHADLELGQKLTRGCECLPMRTTIGAFVRAIENDDGSKKHAVFMPTAKGPCRFGQYSTLERLIFDSTGRDDFLILAPSSDNNYFGLSEPLRRKLWPSLLAGDSLFKATCRVRPYEITEGDTDTMLAKWIAAAERCLEADGDIVEVVRQAGEDYLRIPTRDERRPLVGIVGEIYVRNNEFSNENVVRAVERAGGEAWMTPITEWFLFTATEDVRKFMTLKKSVAEVLAQGRRIIKTRWMQHLEHTVSAAIGPVLADRQEPPVQDTLVAGQRYLPFNIGGEAILSLGRTVHFARQGAAMVINASPFSCMAGNVCASLFTRVERDVRMPVVSLFYDGSGDENARLEVFLANLDSSAARAGPPRAPSRRGFSLKNPFRGAPH